MGRKRKTRPDQEQSAGGDQVVTQAEELLEARPEGPVEQPPEPKTESAAEEPSPQLLGEVAPPLPAEIPAEVPPEAAASVEKFPGEKMLDEIAEAALACAEAQSRMDDIKSDLKIAKEKYDQCVSHLQTLGMRIKADADRPLFKNMNVEEGASAPAENQDDQAWRDSPITMLHDLPDGLLNKLIDNGIKTIGQLEDLRSKIALSETEWPRGIGDKRIFQIEEAMFQFFKNRGINNASPVEQVEGDGDGTVADEEPWDDDDDADQAWEDHVIGDNDEAVGEEGVASSGHELENERAVASYSDIDDL